MNPTDYADAFKVLGIAMMVIGAGILIFLGVISFREQKTECDCDNK